MCDSYPVVFALKLLKDAWLLHMGTPPWRWQQLQVENEDHGAPELWCHPACRVSVLSYLSRLLCMNTCLNASFMTWVVLFLHLVLYL